MKKYFIIFVLFCVSIFFSSCNHKPRYCDELVLPSSDIFINIYDKMDIKEAVNILKSTYNLSYIDTINNIFVGYNNGKCNYSKNDSLFITESILIQSYDDNYNTFYGYELTFQSNSIEELNNIYNEIVSTYYASNNYILSDNDEWGVKFYGKLYNITISRIDTDIRHDEYVDSNTGNKMISGYVYPNYPKLDHAIPVKAIFSIEFVF